MNAESKKNVELKKAFIDKNNVILHIV